MDFQAYSEPEFTAVRATSSAESTAYPGAFLPHASRFEIHGGVFTNNIHNYPGFGPSERTSDIPCLSPDFGRSFWET
ncbi:hypothetical protein MSAN_01521500 [Mycena sanguinolenta]|uniref:Uncharacterized protein n=1 Tax=Mycena sanguinolenta TaxID=230812 RepID=A0A8H6Y4W5_9AGAR|nr:hypothetical protein MSAN_01521500 [Mycena sanguinolenta]